MKKTIIFSLCAILLILPFKLQAVADDPQPVDSLVSLKEVVVSATKTEVSKNRIPLTVSVVNRAVLDETAETGVLSVLSEEVPGVFVTERSVTGYGIGNGSAGSVSIHGVGGVGKVLMLFDGQPVWAGIFGHNVPDIYVASDAEKVEVIRGPGSLLYGSNAMGGVVNVITRKAKEDGVHGKARVMYGSYNTQKYSANAGLRKNKLNLYASANHDRSDGHRDNSAFYITNGYIRAGYDFSVNWNANVSAIIADFKVTNPGTVAVPAIENWAKAFRTTYSASLNNRYESMSGALQVFYNQGAHTIDDGWQNGVAGNYLFRSKDFNRGVALFESFNLFAGNQITLGVDFKQWGGYAWNESKPGETVDEGRMIDKTINETAGYAVIQQAISEKLSANAGVRLENNEAFGNEWIPQAGLSYQPLEGTALKLSASKGFRSPNLRELYMFMPANPELKPESMWNYDLSYLQSLLNDQLNIELTAYVAKGKNMIAVVRGEDGPKNINTGKFTNKGIDFAVNYNLSPALRLRTNYSFLHTDTRISGLAPKHKLFAGIDWNVGGFRIAPNFQYVDGLYMATVDGKDVMESYALLNCKVSWKPADRFTFFINGENLTGTSYQTADGYPMPGIVILGGIDVRF
ncbi:MAG: TonB-dependent receptor [Tannerellaceae bacterium]|jgi:iron complex outermembrane receptor protein|nr:TonB-dependent receptor [Tannerellaceae bacterium]